MSAARPDLSAASAPPKELTAVSAPRPEPPPMDAAGLEQARLRALREDVRSRVENRPGIYRMLGPGGAVLYVGKSVRVRSRLLSYFRAEEGSKARDILAATERITWEGVTSEFAAVLLEMRLIRRWRPPFNKEHNSSRGFSFVRVGGEAATRFTVTATVKADGAAYYGPFRGRLGVRDALRELLDVLQLRDCAAGMPMRFADQGELFQLRRSPECMRGELARCLAPCAAGCSETEYRERVTAARAFLDGRTDVPLRVLEKKMWASAERLHFEHAALLRERMERLRRMRDQLMMLWRETRDLTAAYAVPGYDGTVRVYLLHRGAIAAEVPAPRTAAERRSLAERARRLARGGQPPLHALPPEKLMEVLLVTRWFRTRPDERLRTTPLREVDAHWVPPLEGEAAAAPPGAEVRSA